MKKGFATSAILYTMLLLFLAMMVGILNNLQNKKIILDQLKVETISALDQTNVCDNLNQEIQKYKTGGDAKAEDINAGKTAYVKGELVTGTHENSLTHVATLDSTNDHISLNEYHLTGKTEDDFVLVVTQGTLNIFQNNVNDATRNVVYDMTPKITIEGDKLSVTNLFHREWYAVNHSITITMTVDLYVK